MTKDFRGKEVEIGDTIFYSTTGRWPESRLCEVVEFTTKGFMKVKIIKTNRRDSMHGDVIIVKNDFVVLDK